MLHFNELYITEDGKNLVIDTEIDSDAVYQDCYLSKISVDIADNCENPGLFRNSLTVWEKKVESMGDLDGDNTFTAVDAELYKKLFEMVDVWDVGSADHNGRVYINEDGTMYYKKRVENAEGNLEMMEFPLNEALYSLYKYAVYHYTDVPLSVGPDVP